jgi:hypothetical protein
VAVLTTGIFDTLGWKSGWWVLASLSEAAM